MFLSSTNNEALALILLAVCVLPIAGLIVYSLVKTILNSKKQNDELNNAINGQEKDLEQREIFYDAFGGESNVCSVENEMNRIIVTVEDITLVEADSLKELGATGVLLAGNTVKCGFGDRAKYIYELMK